MSTRTSSRQAAAKATEAMHQNAQQGRKKAAGAGQKRKEPPKEGLPDAKREKQTSIDKQPYVEDDTAEHPDKKTAASKPAETKAASTDREEVVPSNILEKGIIYFFFRGKVNVEEPESIDEVSRTFIVLRPQPHGAGVGSGLVDGENKCRLLMLPKKTVPTSSGERYMGFVEKASTDLKTLKESFLGEEYETKTRGTQHSPTATPLAEGVYAITTTKRASHLAYIITVPSEVSEIQRDFGLRERGSFIVSAKNPQFPGPSNARLPKPPDYPKSVLDDFRGLRWVPLEPKFIDYPNAQFMMLGEAQGRLGKGGLTEEKAPGEANAGEELEHLEHEDEIRADSLDDSEKVFEDLGLSAKEFPKVPTTWE